MLGSLFFTFFRIAELITLIPVIGMLAFFVNGYVNNNQLTPDYILVLFIVATLAGAWALVTLFKQGSVRRNAHFVALVDLAFVGALIAGVYYLRDVTKTDCTNVYGGLSSQGGVQTANGGTTVVIAPWTVNYSPFGVDINKTCAMYKASFAFGIINILLFAVTSFVALTMHRRERDVVEKTYRRSSHGSRRGHHRRSSSHSSRRNYYV